MGINKIMNRIKNITILIVLILSSYFRDLYANDGILAGAFLRMGLGARANAMGGAFTGIAEGPAAAYYNPAGIPFMETRELILSYRFLSLDRNFNYGFMQVLIRLMVEIFQGIITRIFQMQNMLSPCLSDSCRWIFCPSDLLQKCSITAFPKWATTMPRSPKQDWDLTSEF